MNSLRCRLDRKVRPQLVILRRTYKLTYDSSHNNCWVSEQQTPTEKDATKARATDGSRNCGNYTFNIKFRPRPRDFSQTTTADIA